MNELGTHIIELLNESPAVYLPGIGTFKNERVPAHFDESTNSFLAPKQRIVLHEVLGSATPLIQAIAKKSGNTFEDCEEQLKATTGAILLELNEQGESKIQHLGKLVIDDRIISFIPSENEEVALPLYKAIKERKLIAPAKYEAVEKELIENEEVIVTESEIVNEPKFTSDQQKAKENKDTIPSVDYASESTPKEPEFEPKGRSINWVWPVLIILVLVVAGIVFFFNPIQKKTELFLIEKNTPENPISDTVVTSSEPTQLDSNQEASTRSAQLTDPLLNDDRILNDVPVKEKITYEIIIVSFGKLAEAENYVETMLQKGIVLRILENRRAGNLFKVSYGSYSNEEKAQTELSKVRETLAKDAWVYKAIQ